MCSVFCELPSLGLELEVLGDKRPVEGWHPVGDEVMFFYPCLIVVVVGRELNGAEAMNVVM